MANLFLKKRKNLIGIILIIILAGGGFGIGLVYFSHSKSKLPATSSQNRQVKQVVNQQNKVDVLRSLSVPHQEKAKNEKTKGETKKVLKEVSVSTNNQNTQQKRSGENQKILDSLTAPSK